MKVTGEYWITNYGDVMYADGDIGDYNHESYVIDYVQRNIVDEWHNGHKYNNNNEYVDWDEFKKDLAEERFQEELSAASTAQQQDQIKSSYESDPDEFLLRALKELGVNDEDYAIAEGYGDAREYAMKNWSWKRVQGHNVESWVLTPNDLKIIGMGIEDILDQEGVYDDIDNDPDFVFYVSSYQDGRSYTLSLAQLKAGTVNQLNPKSTQIGYTQQASSNWLKDYEKQSQPSFYKNKPIGDSYDPEISFKQWIYLEGVK